MFPTSWFAAGLVTADSAADFMRLAAAAPDRTVSQWRWLAFRDFVEETGGLSPETCRAAYRLGEAEPDAALGTAIMCSVLYQRNCPPDVRVAAMRCERAAVRRAERREPPGE